MTDGRRWKLSEGVRSPGAYTCVEAVTADRAILVSIHGALDMGAAPTVARQLLETVANDVRAVVVDLANVTFIDSSGLGVLNIARTQALHQGVQFSLRAVPAPVRRVLELTDMLQLFDIEP